MGTELAQFTLEDGGTVVVEVPEEPGLARIARGGKSLQQAAASFEHALQEVRKAAAAVLAQFQAMQHSPDSVEVSFAIKLDAQVGAVVAMAGAEAQFQVTLRWQAS